MILAQMEALQEILESDSPEKAEEAFRRALEVERERCARVADRLRDSLLVDGKAKRGSAGAKAALAGDIANQIRKGEL